MSPSVRQPGVHHQELTLMALLVCSWASSSTCFQVNLIEGTRGLIGAPQRNHRWKMGPAQCPAGRWPRAQMLRWACPCLTWPLMLRALGAPRGKVRGFWENPSLGGDILKLDVQKTFCHYGILLPDVCNLKFSLPPLKFDNRISQSAQKPFTRRVSGKFLVLCFSKHDIFQFYKNTCMMSRKKGISWSNSFKSVCVSKGWSWKS